MKNTFNALFAAIILLTIPAVVFGGEKAPQIVVDMAHSELVKIGTDPIIVAAVKSENAKGKTLSQIKETDKVWIATPGIAENMQALMDSPCGLRLRDIQNGAPYIAEIFVMDNQGANVAMSNKTSDYWQGDEDKFTEAYKDGAGAIHIGDVEFDESSQSYLVQVSIPVKDGDVTIGTATIGIDLDRLE